MLNSRRTFTIIAKKPDSKRGIIVRNVSGEWLVDRNIDDLKERGYEDKDITILEDYI